MSDRELYQIVAEVDTGDPRAALLGACIYCGYGPPVCYGAALFVNCTGPRTPCLEDRMALDAASDSESYTNGDREEDTEAGVSRRDAEADFYTNDGG